MGNEVNHKGLNVEQLSTLMRIVQFTLDQDLPFNVKLSIDEFIRNEWMREPDSQLPRGMSYDQWQKQLAKKRVKVVA